MSNDNNIQFEIPNAANRLEEICVQGVKVRFGDNPPEAVTQRLSHELGIVKKLKHASTYLLASMLAKEARRLHYLFYFRGDITSSLISYVSGISDINPMEKKYGGINIPFETTREEYQGIEPTLEMQAGVSFLIYAQSFLARMFPEYRLISYPLPSVDMIRSLRMYITKLEELPCDEFVAEQKDDIDDADDIYKHDHFHILLIGDKQMELARYNKYYSDNGICFEEAQADSMIPKLWEYVKELDNCPEELKGLNVKTYDELLAVVSMMHSTDVFEGDLKKLLVTKELLLFEMIATRDDIFFYLKGKGLDRKDCFEIMNRVRKGRNLSAEQVEIMRKHNVDEWVYGFCNQVRYLFPKAHVAQLIRYYAFCIQSNSNLM
ncbi:hypothetical protein [Eubacterium oxidoreducens]|uniref:DNA polymerase III alpha subunit n=1 Tax=Eubacterium oxidoreducens TaxID=1732 RepID=A0A1G6BIL7_EUBOX|nr:hypothetical protein [Eubacterium oxidoreducens]SDB20429.1 DNA polymerase III alpha subunit [Eubacterium oxidoreducens]